MTASIWLLLAIVLVFAAWLTHHVILFFRVVRRADVETWEKAWSLIPLVTPFIAWRAGMRASAISWVVLAFVYVGLRVLA